MGWGERVGNDKMDFLDRSNGMGREGGLPIRSPMKKRVEGIKAK